MAKARLNGTGKAQAAAQKPSLVAGFLEIDWDKLIQLPRAVWWLFSVMLVVAGGTVGVHYRLSILEAITTEIKVEQKEFRVELVERKTIEAAYTDCLELERANKVKGFVCPMAKPIKVAEPKKPAAKKQQETSPWGWLSLSAFAEQKK